MSIVFWKDCTAMLTSNGATFRSRPFVCVTHLTLATRRRPRPALVVQCDTIIRRIGSLPPDVMQQVDKCLKASFGLS